MRAVFKRGRTAATILALSASALLMAAPAPATMIGSNLLSPADAGICPTATGATESSCTFSQSTLAAEHTAFGGVKTSAGGVITSWRVASGMATPATASVKMRLRSLKARPKAEPQLASPFVELPLDQPGIHAFPARLPFGPEGILALDTVVSGHGDGPASAPLSHEEMRVGELLIWTPSVADGQIVPSPRMVSSDTELLFNATIEPDRDRDGYGDRTQDHCPKDPKRHIHCDRIPPRIKLTYAPRQDFLRGGGVVVHLRSNEAGRIVAGGQIDIKGVSTWGIYPAHKRVTKGEKTMLVLRVPARAREVAARSFAHGRRVTASVSALATDGAGNESGVAVATIKPQR